MYNIAEKQFSISIAPVQSRGGSLLVIFFVNTYLHITHRQHPDTNKDVYTYKYWNCAGIEPPAFGAIGEYSDHCAKSVGTYLLVFIKV
jgi:hypothetical protein